MNSAHGMRLATGPVLGQFVMMGIFGVTLPCCVSMVSLGGLADTGWWAYFFAFLIYLVLVAPFLAWFILYYQRAFWLRGTVLIQRRLVGVRSWDLSREDVVAGSAGLMTDSLGIQVPALFIGNDPTVTLRLWREGWGWGGSHRMTPPQELQALADAISFGRPEDSPSLEAARKLRSLSDSPYS